MDTLSTSPARVTSARVAPPVFVLRDACARAVSIQEAIECGDVDYAHALASDLEQDMAGSIARLEDAARALPSLEETRRAA